MKLIIGLGNIGKEYENTRHNIGFMFADFFVEKVLKEDLAFKKRGNYYYFETNMSGEKIVIIKPATFMNLSGEAVLSAKKWYKVDNNDIIIVYDDIDLNIGSYRYRESGSAGTHNGMKNILCLLKTEELRRLRIGIENRENKNVPLIDYVLGKFSEDELKVIYGDVFEEVGKQILEISVK